MLDVNLLISKWFIRRNGLPLKRKTSVAQKNTSRLIYKLVSYMLHIRRFTAKHNYSPANITAMDEKPVWLDMVSNTTVDKTGARTVTMKSTGHQNCLLFVCLTVKPDGSKLKPFIMFRNAKHKTKNLNDEFKTRCLIVTSSSGWMIMIWQLNILKKLWELSLLFKDFKRSIHTSAIWIVMLRHR